jgi:DNA-binding transcriptional LysR family regulator
MVELRHLRYFVTVAEELNFTRAAERLHMAQPPLSLAIRQLEQELGAPVFVRSSRDVRLTIAGETLLDGARNSLSEVERALASARRAADGELGSLRVGFSWSARFETLPKIGRAFRSRFPDVELLTEEMWNSRMPAALRSGAIAVAVSLCPDMDAGVSYEPVRHEVAVALLPAGHPLAGEREIELSLLANEEFVLFPRELAPRLHDVFVGLCRTAGFEPSLSSASFHSGWELGLLGDTARVALAPESVIGSLPEQIVAVSVAGVVAQLETCIAWHAIDAPPAVERFLEVARAAVQIPGR